MALVASTPTSWVAGDSGTASAALSAPPSTPRNKVSAYFDYQKVCNGSAFERGAEQCRDRGEDWVALGSVGAGFFGALAPEAGEVIEQRRVARDRALPRTAGDQDERVGLRLGRHGRHDGDGEPDPAALRVGRVFRDLEPSATCLGRDQAVGVGDAAGLEREALRLRGGGRGDERGGQQQGGKRAHARIIRG